MITGTIQPRNPPTAAVRDGAVLECPAMEQLLFPFTAIVGQDDLKRALILNAVRPDIGGVLIRGERGTAKSTAVRGLAALLPTLQVVQGCRFACAPDAPAMLCQVCLAASADDKLPEAERPTPFIDLPISATEDRVVGTLDIEKVLRSGERHFEPGVLAAANRGVLYIDEVNLLDDHVVDVLLDAAAMGVNIVEREGVSYSHPARFVLVGTMNPEEGELRPQLTDRFGLSVLVTAVPDIEDRTEILRRRLAFDHEAEEFTGEYEDHEQALRVRVALARERLAAVVITDRHLRITAEVVTAAMVDGHRAELAILKAAHANAAFEGRDVVAVEDLALAARLALPHRRRRGPLEGNVSDMVAVSDVLDRAAKDEAENHSVDGEQHDHGEEESTRSVDAPKSVRQRV
jgi:Mg-chelatase subunit ChlI